MKGYRIKLEIETERDGYDQKIIDLRDSIKIPKASDVSPLIAKKQKWVGIMGLIFDLIANIENNEKAKLTNPSKNEHRNQTPKQNKATVR